MFIFNPYHLKRERIKSETNGHNLKFNLPVWISLVCPLGGSTVIAVKSKGYSEIEQAYSLAALSPLVLYM